MQFNGSCQCNDDERPQAEEEATIITGIVTKLQNNFGMIGNDTFFLRSKVRGPDLTLGDKVLVEAEFVTGMPFKCVAKQLQILHIDLDLNQFHCERVFPPTYKSLTGTEDEPGFEEKGTDRITKKIATNPHSFDGSAISVNFHNPGNSAETHFISSTDQNLLNLNNIPLHSEGSANKTTSEKQLTEMFPGYTIAEIEKRVKKCDFSRLLPEYRHTLIEKSNLPNTAADLLVLLDCETCAAPGTSGFSIPDKNKESSEPPQNAEVTMPPYRLGVQCLRCLRYGHRAREGDWKCAEKRKGKAIRKIRAIMKEYRTERGPVGMGVNNRTNRPVDSNT